MMVLVKVVLLVKVVMVVVDDEDDDDINGDGNEWRWWRQQYIHNITKRTIQIRVCHQ